MSKSLAKQEDIKNTSASMESGGQNYFLSIPDAKTPWFLLGLEYTSFFTHWYESSQGGRRSVVCAGGPEGGGFAVDECGLCQHVLDLFQEGKALREDGSEDAGNSLKKKANGLKAKGQVVLKAVRGNLVLIKNPKTGEKYYEADFDLDDEDSNAQIGLLSLSQAQWDGLIGLINGENTPFIRDGEDLGKRVLYTKKVSKKGKSTNSKYTQVVWSADEEESELPDIEIPEEIANLDLDDYGKIDEEELKKVLDYVTGEASEEVGDDEEVELESDSDDDDEPDNDYLDDVEGEEADYVDDDYEEYAEAEEADDGEYAEEEEVIETDDESPEFEDDIPVLNKPVKKKAPVKKSPVTKPRATTRPVATKSAPAKTAPKKKIAPKKTTPVKKGVVKKSGKTRM